MKNYKKTFIELALQCQALKFGSFTLKSGRISPYFFNAGALHTAEALKLVGECYSQAILDSQCAFDVLFGPAYKGIPLVCATVIALSKHYPNLPYSFNRKEEKGHGEGGLIIGAPLNQRVLIIDDVITAGTAIRESISLITAAQGTLSGIVVALDRQERGQSSLSAIQEIQSQHNIPVISLIQLDDIIEYARLMPSCKPFHQSLTLYREEYGVY